MKIKLVKGTSLQGPPYHATQLMLWSIVDSEDISYVDLYGSGDRSQLYNLVLLYYLSTILANIQIYCYLFCPFMSNKYPGDKGG